MTDTLEQKPKARTHWSSRLMAEKSGISDHSVRRIWKAFGLKPHQSEGFKLSKDPMFVEKVRDIVGLYLNPPEKAVVLCVDEKSQCQALERTQPIFPMRPGIPESQSHDYEPHGTLSLFAAYDTATGRVLGKSHARHRSQEFLGFFLFGQPAQEGHGRIHPNAQRRSQTLQMDGHGRFDLPENAGFYFLS